MRDRELYARIPGTTMKVRAAALACALCWLAIPAHASGESRANLLFVEAAKLIGAAEKETGAVRKLELLKSAQRKLDRIVDRHPSTDLAVKLVSGQEIGTISLAGLTDAIEVVTLISLPECKPKSSKLWKPLQLRRRLKYPFIMLWRSAILPERRPKLDKLWKPLQLRRRLKMPIIVPRRSSRLLKYM